MQIRYPRVLKRAAGRAPILCVSGRVMGAHLELEADAGRSDRDDKIAIHYFARLASHSRMNAISAVCSLMISSAILRVSGSFPYFSTTSAISIAPW